MRVRHGVVAAAVAALAFAGASPAGADPKTGDQIHLSCGSAGYDVVVAGNGTWTPAHDTTSTRVFVPTSFGTFTGTVRNESGEIVDEFTDPSVVSKGSGARDTKADVIDCTYTFTEVSDGSDPSFPAGYTFTGVGDVRGFIPSGR